MKLHFRNGWRNIFQAADCLDLLSVRWEFAKLATDKIWYWEVAFAFLNFEVALDWNRAGHNGRLPGE